VSPVSPPRGTFSSRLEWLQNPWYVTFSVCRASFRDLAIGTREMFLAIGTKLVLLDEVRKAPTVILNYWSVDEVYIIKQDFNMHITQQHFQ
jgi:hypothetical protein